MGHQNLKVYFVFLGTKLNLLYQSKVEIEKKLWTISYNSYTNIPPYSQKKKKKIYIYITNKQTTSPTKIFNLIFFNGSYMRCFKILWISFVPLEEFFFYPLNFSILYLLSLKISKCMLKFFLFFLFFYFLYNNVTLMFYSF